MSTFDELLKLHSAIDLMVDQIVRVIGSRLNCRRGCIECCSDELTVFAIEAERIRQAAPELLLAGTPHPVGRCAFLSDHGDCRVFAHRPYVCRTQGLPLRWIDIDEAGEPVEHRDICPLNEPGPSIVELPPEQCWTIGAVEQRLASLQAAHGNGELERVKLRQLFERS